LPIVTNIGRINRVRDGVEAVKRDTGSGKRRPSAQTDFNAKCIPAIDHIRPDTHIFEATGHDEKLPKECVERADEIGVTQRGREPEGATSREKRVYRRISERQHSYAFARREGRRHRLNAFNDRTRLATAGARLHEGLGWMRGERTLLRGRLAHPATARIASRR
jgi:hypothetical protein